jgi:hypothetical protein
VSSSANETPHDRFIRLAFGGDRIRYERFLDLLRDVTPPDVQVILRGSAVTGTRWSDGQPFDSDGPGTSDLDITFVGRGMMEHWESFYIPAMHTVPMSDEHPDAAPKLKRLRQRLCALAGRPVNLQATTSLVQFARDVLLEQPYITILAKESDDNTDAAAPRES